MHIYGCTQTWTCTHTQRCCLPSTTAIRSRHHHYTVPAGEGDIGQDMACPRPPRSRSVGSTGDNNGMGRNAENKGWSPQRSRRKHCQSCQSLTRSGVGGGRRTQTVPTAQENKADTAKVRHPAVGDITDCQDLDQEMLTAQGSPPPLNTVLRQWRALPKLLPSRATWP